MALCIVLRALPAIPRSHIDLLSNGIVWKQRDYTEQRETGIFHKAGLCSLLRGWCLGAVSVLGVLVCY